MPPFVGRKRTLSPDKGPPKKKQKPTPKATRPALKKESSRFTLGSESSSSLSDVDSEQFQDVVQPRQNGQHGDESDDGDFEDVVGETPASELAKFDFQEVKLNISKDDQIIDYTAGKKDGRKGPNRREKLARVRTHQLHVQFLLWHNAIRNKWIGDKDVQATLLRQLPSQISREVEKWKRASGLAPPEKPVTTGKKKKKNRSANRDWGEPSQRLEEGKPDMSHGDPTIPLLKVLVAYWRKRFAITAPGLRKRGYGPKYELRRDIHSYREEEHDPARHGERIRNLDEFRRIAETCEASRDVGAQLFTALLRAIGIEARVVASLQVAGYGWTKAEQMVPRRHVENMPVHPDEGRPVKEETITLQSPPDTTKKEVVRLDSDISSDADDLAITNVTASMPRARPAKFDRDLVFPVYWTEVVSPITSKIIPVSPLLFENAVATSPEILASFEPRGAKADATRQVMAYVVAYSPDGTAKDVTVRYLRKKVWPGKTKGFRYPAGKMPIYGERGKVVGYEEQDWFAECMEGYLRPLDKRTRVDELEEVDLTPAEPEKKADEEDTLSSLKSSDKWVLERHLRREEALKPGATPDRMFVSGKGDKQTEEPVYQRRDVERCLTTESWHKEGRIPRQGEMPMKFVPVRAVTLTRKREAEEHKMRTGEQQMQGLYSIRQTEYIIPPPIRNGVIPKNGYGNIDCFASHMVPQGAVHVQLKGAPRICKKLEIDFAEAVVGFEFGNKMAVPVIQGVVVAVENETMLREAWEEWNEEQKRKQDEKLQKQVLELWRKFVIGLRIRQRVSDVYAVDLDRIPNSGNVREDAISIASDEGTAGPSPANLENGEGGGGFFLEHEEEHHGDDLVFEAPAASQDRAKTKMTGISEAELSASSPSDDDVEGICEESVSNGNSSKKASSYTSDEEEEIPVVAAGSKKGFNTRRTSGRRDGGRTEAESSLTGKLVTTSKKGHRQVTNTKVVKSIAEPAVKESRGRRRKSGRTVNGQRSGRQSGMLQEESSLVTSPYFSGSSQQ